MILNLSSQGVFPSLPSNVCGGKKFFLSLHFSIFYLVHVQFICFFQYRWPAVYLNSFYPVTGLPVKRTAVTQTAHYLWYLSIIFTCIMLILIQPKIYEFYLTLTHPAGGQAIFSLIPIVYVRNDFSNMTVWKIFQSSLLQLFLRFSDIKGVIVTCRFFQLCACRKEFPKILVNHFPWFFCRLYFQLVLIKCV